MQKKLPFRSGLISVAKVKDDGNAGDWSIVDDSFVVDIFILINRTTKNYIILNI